MIYLLAGGLLFWLLIIALKAFAAADPALLARMLGRGGGGGAVWGGAIRGFRVRMDRALGLGGLGAWLIGLGGRPLSRLFHPARASRRGNASCVRSAMIEMELDHDTGQMRGTV